MAHLVEANNRKAEGEAESTGEGRFKIRQIIGEGVTSTVYKALDTLQNKLVAIKVFSARSRGPGSECRLLSLLDCEHVVKIDRVLGPGSFSMEFCEGSLIAFLNEHELDIRGIKKIIRMVLIGVHEIHTKGIIHRDLKLGNILLRGDCAKICDFGLACLEGEGYGYCGTRDYLAPEVEEGRPYSHKVDIWAVGAIYKILLTRKKNVELGEIEVAGDVKALIGRLMDVDPARRTSALEALRHGSFNELFQPVPDFRRLKEHSKETKYGRVSKTFDRATGHHRIEMRYGGTALGIVAPEAGELKHAILLNGCPVEEKLLPNTPLKYFNYLVSYFRLLLDREIRYSLREGDLWYFKTLSGWRVLECSRYRVRRLGDRTELVFLPGGTPAFCSALPQEIENAFRDLEFRATKGTPLVDHGTQNFSIAPEVLVKKFQFCSGLGWCFKEGLRFTLLLNDGTRVGVAVEDFTAVANDGGCVPLRELDVGLLVTIRKFISKFV